MQHDCIYNIIYIHKRSQSTLLQVGTKCGQFSINQSTKFSNAIHKRNINGVILLLIPPLIKYINFTTCDVNFIIHGLEQVGFSLSLDRRNSWLCKLGCLASEKKKKNQRNIINELIIINGNYCYNFRFVQWMQTSF